MAIDLIENEESGLSVRGKLNQTISLANNYNNHKDDTDIHFTQDQISIFEYQIEDLGNYIENLNNFTTSDLNEGTNLYFTNERAVTAIKNDPDWNADNWDIAHSWGNHSEVGYTISEVDESISGEWTFETILRIESTILVGAEGQEPDAIRIDGDNIQSRIKASSFSQQPATLLLHQHSTSQAGEIIIARSNSQGSNHATVENDQKMGGVRSVGWADGSVGYLPVAEIEFKTDVTGTINENSMPGKLIFKTTKDGEKLPSPVLEIDSSQRVKIHGEEVWDTGDFDQNNINNWDMAHSWGNHSEVGYLTDYTVTEADVTQHQNTLSINWSQLDNIADLIEEGDDISLLNNDANYLTRVNRNVFLSSNNVVSEISDTDSIAEYVGSIDTSGSEITFNITKDGTSGGEAIFDNLAACGISLVCERDTTSSNEAPWAHVKEINGNSIVVRVMRSNTGGILVGGSYQGNEPNTNSVVVRLRVLGVST